MEPFKYEGRPKFDVDAQFLANLPQSLGKLSAELGYIKDDEKRLLSGFKRLKTDEERVSYVWDFYIKYKIFYNDYGADASKSLSESIKFRLKGNDYFKKRDYKTALTVYTKSVALAPYPSGHKMPRQTEKESEAETALAFAVANRSAVLFELKKYESCLKDISFALDMNYPVSLQYKLQNRRIKCLHAVGKFEYIQDALQVAMESLNLTDNLTESKRQSLEKEIEKISKDTSKPVTKQRPVRELKLDSETNPALPGCSDYVELRTTTDMGRGLFATKEIKLGDVILIEKPFSSLLNKDFYNSYCHHCCKKCNALVPCLNCSLVMFCSEDCRAVSWKKYHSVECKLLPLMLFVNCNPRHYLAIRTVFIGASSFKDLEEFYNTVMRFENSNIDENTRNLEYFKMYNLVTNLEHIAPESLIRFYMLAVFNVMMVDNRVNYFSVNSTGGKQSKALKNKLKNFFARLFMKHLMNQTVELFLCTKDENNVVTELSQVGDGIYSTLNMVNHSCDPNTFRYTPYDNQVVLCALRDIKKGEQIFCSYGPMYHHNTSLKDRRKTLLESYYFTCRCVACTRNWPSMDQLKGSKQKLKCKSCGHELSEEMDLPGVTICRVGNCKHPNSTFRVTLKLCNFMAQLEEKCRNGTMQVGDVVKVLNYIDSRFCKPSSDHILCLKYLRNCFIRRHCHYDM